jgi:hypothetical protein
MKLTRLSEDTGYDPKYADPSYDPGSYDVLKSEPRKSPKSLEYLGAQKDLRKAMDIVELGIEEAGFHPARVEIKSSPVRGYIQILDPLEQDWVEIEINPVLKKAILVDREGDFIWERLLPDLKALLKQIGYDVSPR